MNAPNQQSDSFSDLEQATDRLFDRELTTAERQALSAQLSSDPEALKRFRQTTDALLALREPIETPDVTKAVLARLDERPGFTTRHTRRIITTGRLAVAAALLGAGAGVVLLENEAETRTSTVAIEDPKPIDAVIAQLHDKDLAAREIEALQADASFSSDSSARPLYRSLEAPPLDLSLTSPLIAPDAFEATAFTLDPLLALTDLTEPLDQGTLTANRWQLEPIDPFPLKPESASPGPVFPPESSANPLLDWSPIEFQLPTNPLGLDDALLVYPPMLEPSDFHPEPILKPNED